MKRRGFLGLLSACFAAIACGVKPAKAKEMAVTYNGVTFPLGTRYCLVSRAMAGDGKEIQWQGRVVGLNAGEARAAVGDACRLPLGYRRSSQSYEVNMFCDELSFEILDSRIE